MTLNGFVALAAALVVQANPSPMAIPQQMEVQPAYRIAVRTPNQPERVRADSYGVRTTANAAIVADVSSGAVLYAKKATVAYPIASLTKIMTSMVLIDAGLQPDELITIKASHVEAQGSHALNDGDTVKRSEALHAMLVQSLNEAANAFAEAYPGGRAAFVAAMNEKARTLGLEKTHFEDPSGISSRNVASALDVARMLRSALAYSEIREATQSGIYLLKTTAGRAVEIEPTNQLLTSYLGKDPYRIVLGKTGSLPEAGFCLGMVTRKAEGQQVISVVLGSDTHPSRFQDVKAMTAWAFEAFSWK